MQVWVSPLGTEAEIASVQRLLVARSSEIPSAGGGVGMGNLSWASGDARDADEGGIDVGVGAD